MKNKIKEIKIKYPEEFECIEILTLSIIIVMTIMIIFHGLGWV